ncbi:MAG: hypothetical protein ACE5EU_15440, partial [Paracoccaceae bacterium]
VDVFFGPALVSVAHRGKAVHREPSAVRGGAAMNVSSGSSPCKNVFGFSVVRGPGSDLIDFPGFSVLLGFCRISGVFCCSDSDRW